MFEVGQEVWSTLFGKGIVISIDEHPEYPIKVKFEEDYFTFTAEGVWGGCEGPSLFPYPVKVVPEDIPDYPFMLDGKPIKLGDFLFVKGELIQVEKLMLEKGQVLICSPDLSTFWLILSPELKWADPRVFTKRRWAYIQEDENHNSVVRFTEPISLVEARRRHPAVWPLPDKEEQ